MCTSQKMQVCNCSACLWTLTRLASCTPICQLQQSCSTARQLLFNTLLRLSGADSHVLYHTQSAPPVPRTLLPGHPYPPAPPAQTPHALNDLKSYSRIVCALGLPKTWIECQLHAVETTDGSKVVLMASRLY